MPIEGNREKGRGMMTSLPHCGSAGGDAVRRFLEAIGSPYLM